MSKPKNAPKTTATNSPKATAVKNHKKPKSIKKNYLYNLSFQILTILIPLITTPYLARILEVSGIGISSFTISIASYFILFSSFGIAEYGQRQIAMERSDKKKYSTTFWELFIYKAITTTISIIFYLIFILSTTEYTVLYFVLTLTLVASIFDISWFYQGLEEYRLISLRNIAIKLLFTISIFVFVKTAEDLTLYIVLYSLSQLLSSIALWFPIKKFITKISKKSLRIFRHTKDTFIYFLPQIATQIYTTVDKTMLGLMTGSQLENGYYEQAHKITQVAQTLVISLNTVMLPRMAYLYAKKRFDEIKTRLVKSLRFSYLLAFPICFGLIAIAADLVPWFFGPGYEKVVPLLMIFAPLIIIISISNCLGSQCLTPCGKRLQSALALWLGAILNVILNFSLIPALGSIGAAFSSVAAELLIVFLYFVLAKNYVSFLNAIKCSWKYCLSALIMFITVFAIASILPPTILSTFIEIIVGTIVYALVLIYFKDDLFTSYVKEGKTHAKRITRRN